MCGITGLLGRGAQKREIVKAMTDRLAHRGPDDDGVWTDPDAGIALGHRRLAIVDLSQAGHEPMFSDSGRFVVTFNGEIYNHAEIRNLLDSQGLMPAGGWRGHSDIETLLEAIDHWGLENALDAAVGMFALALWDRSARTLRLVRDRFGEKPLYYGWAGKDFVFGSELKAITVHPHFQREIDRESLAAFMARQYIPAPQSIYRGIFKLLPGCILTIDADEPYPRRETPPIFPERGANPRIERYWDYAAIVRAGANNRFTDAIDAIDQIENVLGAAIKGQSIADVAVGAFLSGGIDSSTVVALYQKFSDIPVRTYTIGFEESGFNEAAHAKKVAEHLGTVHHEQYVSGRDALDVIPHLAQIYDEPFADSSQIPTFLVSRFARSQVTVALTGDGGDELFGGYLRHYMLSRMWRRISWLGNSGRRLVLGPLEYLPDSVMGMLGRVAGVRDRADGVRKIRKALHVAGRARNIAEFASSFAQDRLMEGSLVSGANSTFCSADSRLGGQAIALDQLTFQDAVSYLPDDILCKVDRASMAVALEARVPFLDHRVAAVAARVPPNMKISASEGKIVLKSLLAKHVPASLFDRPKAGFSVPLDDWLRGSLREWADDLLSPDLLKRQGILDTEAVQDLWNHHKQARPSNVNAIWSLLMFESWISA